VFPGNVGNAFSLDAATGALQVARDLDLGATKEYMLTVKASDGGSPSLSSTLRVHVMLTMADNAPPRFARREFAAEIFENSARGSLVVQLEARATSSLFFEIVDGDTDDMFDVNPSTGVVVTKRSLDYELSHFYNLTVTATNMVSRNTV
jgi:protocadherin Fat 1/2/3